MLTHFLFIIPGLAALSDAELDYHQVQAVVASYCYGEPTSGQRAVYELGLTGVPVFNVNNNCSSGSSALMLARRLVQSGIEDCVLALGKLIKFGVPAFDVNKFFGCCPLTKHCHLYYLYCNAVLLCQW